MKVNIRNKWMMGVIATAVVVLCIFVPKPRSAPKTAPLSASVDTASPSEGFREDGSSLNIVDIETWQPEANDMEHVILVNRTEAARFKTRDGKIFDKIGVIPNGKIRFVNDFEKTYGVANYVQENLDGELLEYYANGQLKTRAVYSNGQLKERKVYYGNGKIFSEEDLSKTTFVSEFTRYSSLKNIGTGKIYRFNGAVKYEWHATDEDEKFYAKYFNSTGDLREAFYYDKSGTLIEHWTPAAVNGTGETK